jgi:MFS family permease
MHSVRVYPAFRMLMLGTLASNTAFWMYQVAVGWLALEMTDSPFFVGMAGFAGGIPLLLVSLPAGVIIDRFDRRNVLVAAQVGVMVVAAVFALLVGTGLVGRVSMLVLVAAYGTIMSFVFPTRTAIVPSLVRRGDLPNAVALNAAGQNATRVVGPALAGVMIAAVGVSATFAVAAAMQILALFTTSRLPGSASEAVARSGTVGASLTVGLRVVAGNPALLAPMLLAFGSNVLVMPYINLMPVFARDVFGLGATGLGLMLAATGLGTVAGALGVARAPGRGDRFGAQVAAAAAFAALVLAFAVSPSVLLAVPLLFAAGWGSAAFLAMNQTALQLNVDDAVRGRVLSIYLLTWGVLPLGQLAVGAVAARTGAPAATAIACALALASVGLVARRYPSLRG